MFVEAGSRSKKRRGVEHSWFATTSLPKVNRQGPEALKGECPERQAKETSIMKIKEGSVRPGGGGTKPAKRREGKYYLNKKSACVYQGNKNPPN